MLAPIKMRDAAGRCGLEMNAMKSKCMIFNYRGAPFELLKGMKMVEQLRYLGVTVVNRRNCFVLQMLQDFGSKKNSQPGHQQTFQTSKVVFQHDSPCSKGNTFNAAVLVLHTNFPQL